MALSSEVVDALYRALLGRPADAAGARHWASANSVDEVIEGFTTTDEFAQRVEQLGVMSTRTPGASLTAAGLVLGRGFASLDHAEPWAAYRWLTALPWDELARAGATPTALALGPYARELAREAVGRGLVTACSAGLDDPAAGEVPRHDVLLLTEFAYLETVMALRVDLVTATRRRLLCPAPALRPDRRQRAAAMTSARLSLHRAGFVEVALLVRRRYGGSTAVHDVTHSTPDPERLLLARPSDGSGPTPACGWLVADRVPRHER